MATKDLYVYVNDVGQKIKTSGLTFNQNSTNSLIHFITVGYFKAITAAFRTADGELSANYNVPYTGKYTITSDDTEPALVENADDLYEYELYIPYKVSSTFIVASSSRISVAFHCFNYDNNTKVLVNTMTANTQLLMNRADVSDSIDESYNLTDVENLWKTVNDLNYYNDTQDTLISANSTAISSEATRAKAAEAALDTAKADKATTLAGYGITDAYTKAETSTELAKYLPLTGGTLTGVLYTSSSTPFFIGLDGKVGMRASDSNNKNYGQMNISNTWYDSTHWGAQMSAYNAETDKYNAIRISHNGAQYIDESDTAHLLGYADDITAEAARATAAEATLQAAINTKLDAAPDGVNNLIVNNKLNQLYISDSILGQVIYGGTIAADGSCALSDLFKAKYPSISSLTITTNGANAYTGVYFIASASVSIAADGTYAAIELLTGDWLLSNGSTGYTKVDNTDAVTGVKGNSEATYRIGNINLTSDNIGTYDKSTIDSKIEAKSVRTIDFNATVSGTTMTAASADWASTDIETGGIYIIDILYPATIDTVSSDTVVLSFNDGVTVNIYSSLNATGTCRLLDLEQVQYPYNAQTGHRYIFEALAGKNANSELIFTMIPATSQQDIISITSKELLDIVGGVVPFEYNNEQLFYVTDAGTNGYKQGHTYKAIYNFTTNEVTTEDTTAVSAFETYTTVADFQAVHPAATTKYLYNIELNYTDISNIFNTYSNLIGINMLDTANVTNMDRMFSGCSSLVSVPAFNTANVTEMGNMLRNCASLVSVPAFNTANVTDMSFMFFGCASLVSVPAFNTANVTSMYGMFHGCASLVSVPAFNTANVTDMKRMFLDCVSLVSVPAFNTANVTDMSFMFSSCASLVSVPAFNTANVTHMGNIFASCASLLAIHMTGMKVSFDISASTKFTRDALNEIIGNLATVTTATTLTMGAANLAKLTAEDIAVGTNKGWTIA